VDIPNPMQGVTALPAQPASTQAAPRDDRALRETAEAFEAAFLSEMLQQTGLNARICEALLPLVSQLSVARSVASIVAGGETEYLADLAGRAAARLLALIARGQFADDEEEDLAEVVAAYLLVENLGSEGDLLRRRIAAQLSGLKLRVNQRTRAALREGMPKLEASIRDRLDWV
jgi:hypothetical protein